MTWVKICGMTNLEDALVAVEAGADAVGFVFCEKSPRCVSVETTREIVEKLPDRVETVGVFAGESLMTAAEVSARVGFDSLQLYAPQEPDSVAVLERAGLRRPSQREAGQRKIYLALQVPHSTGERELEIEMADPDGEFVALLLDSGNSAQPGGTGAPFDWNSAAKVIESLNSRHKIVVAGGLRADNVAMAMRVLRPWGVDVVSGVEARPGKKDPEKVRAFVQAVREADRKRA